MDLLVTNIPVSQGSHPFRQGTHRAGCWVTSLRSLANPGSAGGEAVSLGTISQDKSYHFFL